ncbi:MAG: glycine cleavage system aminomethyltransferase GcvT [Candidatus Binatia bacterium]|nr:glycine cleavage system aminomethyltransferase GcvT [Candidatus Binatia bacterium]
MTVRENTSLARSPLHERHRALRARFIAFAGWEMPLQYRSVTEEHLAVRQTAGLFDVSHMGEIELCGAHALAAVQRLATNDAERLQPGRGQYSLLCLPSGGVIDDLVVYRLEIDRFLLCVNAINTEKDVRWLQEHAAAITSVVDRSREYALLALQGPRATSILSAVAGNTTLAQTPRYGCVTIAPAGKPAFCSRSGYTGEDGWEIFCSWDDAPAIWDALLDCGGPLGLLPCGLGARDTLRIEAGLPLYGHEIDETTTPIEAQLQWAVRCEKHEFVGKDVLCRQKACGVARKLVALLLTEPGIPRQGYKIVKDGSRIGVVTSGCKSPVLGTGIGLGYVASAEAEVGNRVQIEIRERLVPAEIVARPFVRPDR